MKILVIIAFFMSELLFAAPADPRNNITNQIKRTVVTHRIKSDIKKDLVKDKVSKKFAAKKASARANVRTKAGNKVKNIANNRYNKVVEGDANPKTLGKAVKLIKII